MDNLSTNRDNLENFSCLSLCLCDFLIFLCNFYNTEVVFRSSDKNSSVL